MKNMRILVLSVLLCALISACGGGVETTASPEESEASPTPGGRNASFTVVTNDVQARDRQGDDYQPAEIGQVLQVSGQARTGAESRAQLDLMPDDTIVRMGPDTSFTLSEMAEVEQDFFARLELELGQLWIILSGGELQVETNIGIASVRGSMMHVRYTPGGAMIITCLEGHCRVSNAHGSVDLTAGQAVEIPDGDSPPSAPRPLTEDELHDWMKVLKCVQRGPRLGDRVWLDMNADGIQDPLEEGLEGVFVLLIDISENVIDTTVTDEYGYYSFPFVPAGKYYLIFEPPEGYLFTILDAIADDSMDSDAHPDVGKTYYFHIPEDNMTLLDMDAGVYPLSAAPEPTVTPTPTNTPEPPPPCGCYTSGVLFEVIKYDGSPGWSDCGQASACHSIIGNSQVESGTYINSGACEMKITCPRREDVLTPTPSD